MKMKILYIANDGTQFEDEWECTDYEWILAHPHLKEIKFLNAAGEPALSDPLDDITYNNTETVIVPNEEALQELQDLADYAGFCEYKDIDSIGTWNHYDGTISNGGFRKVEKEDANGKRRN